MSIWGKREEREEEEIGGGKVKVSCLGIDPLAHVDDGSFI